VVQAEHVALAVRLVPQVPSVLLVTMALLAPKAFKARKVFLAQTVRWAPQVLLRPFHSMAR
jgi:hypothetical protein